MGIFHCDFLAISKIVFAAGQKVELKDIEISATCGHRTRDKMKTRETSLPAKYLQLYIYARNEHYQHTKKSQ